MFRIRQIRHRNRNKNREACLVRSCLILIGIFCLLSSFCLADTPRRSYKYYLDASRAEEILSGLVRPRLYDDEWLDIIRGLKGEKYSVRPGDTLWDISSKQFGDAFLWRKLWHVNSFLNNPHSISVGQMLDYYRPGSGTSAPILRIPLVKLVPGGSADLDNDSFVNQDLKNRYYPLLMVLADEEILGEVSGAYTLRTAFSELDEIYLDLFNADSVRIGERLAVVKFERVIHDRSSPGSPVIGTLMRLVGEVSIVTIGENLVKADIMALMGTMSRGDRVIDLQKAVNWSAYFNPPDDLTARIVAGENEDMSIFSQGDLVLLNKGTDDGMKPGFLFRVFRDMDPLTLSRWDVEPDYKGEIQIIHSNELSSLGYVMRNKASLFVGDTLIANQLFADPPPPPRRPQTVISID